MTAKQKLDAGDTLPELTLTWADGSSSTLPSDLETPYAVLLFYRGHW